MVERGKCEKEMWSEGEPMGRCPYVASVRVWTDREPDKIEYCNAHSILACVALKEYGEVVHHERIGGPSPDGAEPTE